MFPTPLELSIKAIINTLGDFDASKLILGGIPYPTLGLGFAGPMISAVYILQLPGAYGVLLSNQFSPYLSVLLHPGILCGTPPLPMLAPTYIPIIIPMAPTPAVLLIVTNSAIDAAFHSCPAHSNTFHLGLILTAISFSIVPPFLMLPSISKTLAMNVNSNINNANNANNASNANGTNNANNASNVNGTNNANNENFVITTSIPNDNLDGFKPYKEETVKECN